MPLNLFNSKPDKPVARRFSTQRNALLILALCTGLLSVACSKEPELSDAVQGLTLSTLTGDQIRLAELSGPVLINFWATDCVICIREMPELSALYGDYSPAGFELIAIAMPYDPPNRVLEMAEREQWPFPVALDVTGDALAAFATVKGTPTSFLLDRQGKLVTTYIGAVPIDKLQQQLDSLLAL